MRGDFVLRSRGLNSRRSGGDCVCRWNSVYEVRLMGGILGRT